MRSIAQKFAKVFGAVYLLVGAVGFLSVVGGTSSQTPNLLLGIFGVTLAHNLAHLAVGAAFVAGSYSPKSARVTCVAIGATYLLLGTVGLLEYQAVDELLNINLADNLLHFATGLFALMFGLVDVPVKEAKQKAERSTRSSIKAQKSAAVSEQEPAVVPVNEEVLIPATEEVEVFAAAEAVAPEPVVQAPVKSRKEKAPKAAKAPKAPKAPKAIKPPKESRSQKKARTAEPVQVPAVAQAISAATIDEAAVPEETPARYPGSTQKIKWESRSARAAREADAVPRVESAQSWISGEAPAPTSDGADMVAPAPVETSVAQSPQAIAPESTQELPLPSKKLTPRQLSKEAQRTAKAARQANKAGAAVPVAPAPQAAQAPVAQESEISAAIKSIQPPVSAADRKNAKQEAKAARRARKSPPAPAAGPGIGPEMERLDAPVLVGGPAMDQTQELPSDRS